MPATGSLTTDNAVCSVTVVSEWLVITAKHCGTANPKLKLNTAEVSNARQSRVKSITPNPTLDVEAIFLHQKTGLPVTPLRSSITSDSFSAWGYGFDYSSKETNHLTRANFNLTGSTPTAACPASIDLSQVGLCWQTSAVNNVCSGDSGGAVTQNDAIIGLVKSVTFTGKKPDGSIDCSKVIIGEAVTVQQMQPWLDQMIKAAVPVN